MPQYTLNLEQQILIEAPAEVAYIERCVFEVCEYTESMKF